MFEKELHISLYVFRQAVRLGYNDWPFKLKAPAEYKFRNYFNPLFNPFKEVIELSSSVAGGVGRRRTLPQLPPVNPSVPSCSNRKESSILNGNCQLRSGIVCPDCNCIVDTFDTLKKHAGVTLAHRSQRAHSESMLPLSYLTLGAFSLRACV